MPFSLTFRYAVNASSEKVLFREKMLPLCWLLWFMSHLAVEASSDGEVQLLQGAVHALNKGLEFMENHADKINLDGAFGCRIVEELLHAFMESRTDIVDAIGHELRQQLEDITEKADGIVSRSKPYLKTNQPLYFEGLGGLLDKSRVLMWHPSRMTSHALELPPLPCDESIFNETLSDHCLQQLLGSRLAGTEACSISKGCIRMMTAPRQRGYMITHQVLYFQLVEAHDCLAKSNVRIIPQSLQDSLCSNVFRDAKEIADSGYPADHRDLFMEQIGLCGLWGYKDFYRPEWISSILEWQEKSGCYANLDRWECRENLMERKTRVRREEKRLEGDCLSHKTTVALAAIAANIRFLIEKIYNEQMASPYV